PGHARAQVPVLGRHARLRDPRVARAALRRAARDRRQRHLSGAASPRGTRSRACRVGRERQEPPRALLSSHAGRPRPTPRRRLALDRVRRNAHRHHARPAQPGLTGAFLVHRRFRRLFRHVPDRADRLEREWDDEIQSHIAGRVEQLVARGLSPDEARREALRRFGDVDAARAVSAATATRRAARIRTRARLGDLRTMVGGLPQDLKLGLRALRAHPAFAVATIATLGLAISAAVTAFSFADAIFLRPLPAPSADRIVRVYLPRSDHRVTQVGEAGAGLLRARRDVFERVAAERCCWVKFVRERGSLDQRYAAFASSEFFPMLGVSPALGRFFLPSETSHDGGDPVAILSYSLWQRRFGADPHVLGEHILIATVDFTIVGVAPPGFVGVSAGQAPSEIWLPSTMKAAVGIGCT